MKTPHEVAVALAVASILLFIVGFVMTAILLTQTLVPTVSSPALLAPEIAVQYLLAITIFEASSALPCAIISFAIKMNS